MEVLNFNQEVSFMARPSKNPHSTIAQLRSALGIGQADLARILGVSNITISNWETGDIVSKRGSGGDTLAALMALLKQSVKEPEFLEPEVLRKYLKLAAKGELLPYYAPYGDQMDGQYAEAIGSGLLVGVLLALLFDAHLEKSGKPSPRQHIMGSEKIPVTTLKSMSDEDLFQKLLPGSSL